MLVQKALVAAQQIEQRQPGVSVEVIDLRSLSPFDWGAIEASVRKTSRVVVAQEDCLSWGYGSEISARIANDLFGHLDAPVGRIGALDTWVAYNPKLEDEILPQTEDLVREAERILAY
jgi:2-oxoisovalerate dehydrogenase E1 component